MRIKLINAVTGTEMWVADNRLDEYIAAGHRPAAAPEEMPTEEPVKEEPIKEEPKKKKTVSRKK